jgi:glycosyltransferase involved in cell wall biosynthesis
VRVLLALPALLAQRVVVNSVFSRDVLVEAVPRLQHRSVVVYNGVAGPPDVSPPRARPDQPLQLVYVGRLSPRKGPQVAVAAVAELQRRGVRAHLRLVGAVFAGYEWFEQQLRDQVAAAGLEAQVEFVGFVPDVWGAVVAADVVLIPSLVDEPFGNTAVEAVLAARPVVASATSGLREAVAGYRSAQSVTPGDTEAWVDAVQRVVKEWDDYSAQAIADAADARRRYDPLRYRAEVARVVTTEAGLP